MATAEFVVNNKFYSAKKVTLFMAKYRRKLRMGSNIRRKRKVEMTTEFTERIKKVGSYKMREIR